MLTIALLLASLTAPAQEPAPGPAGFHALTFEAALEAAKAEKHWVLVDFFSAGAPESKLNDELLWKDDIVRRWLDARVIAIHVEVKEQAGLAARYSVVSTPLTLIVDTDGVEAERLLGTQQPREFAQRASEIMRTASAIAYVRKQFLEAPDCAKLHLQLGQTFFDTKRFDAALSEYLNVWDRADTDLDAVALKRRTLPGLLGNVLRAYPAARRELAPRRDAVRERLFKPAEGEDLVALAYAVTGLNLALGADDRQLETFRSLRDRPEVPRDAVKVLFTEGCATILLQQRKFQELLDARGDVLAQMQELYADLARDIEGAAAKTDPEFDRARAATRHEQRRAGLSILGGMYMEALCSVGKEQDARGMVALVVAHDPRGRAYAALLGGASRGGRKDLAREIADAGNAALTDPAERERLEKAVRLNLAEQK